jgi:hypothetical protein
MPARRTKQQWRSKSVRGTASLWASSAWAGSQDGGCPSSRHSSLELHHSPQPAIIIPLTVIDISKLLMAKDASHNPCRQHNEQQNRRPRQQWNQNPPETRLRIHRDHCTACGQWAHSQPVGQTIAIPHEITCRRDQTYHLANRHPLLLKGK